MPRLNALSALSIVLCGTATSDAQIISDLMALSGANQGTTAPSPAHKLQTPYAAPQGNNSATTLPRSQAFLSTYTAYEGHDGELGHDMKCGFPSQQAIEEYCDSYRACGGYSYYLNYHTWWCAKSTYTLGPSRGPGNWWYQKTATACGTDGANWRGFSGNEDLPFQPLTNIDSSCTCNAQCSVSRDCQFWSYDKLGRRCWLRKQFKSVQVDRSYTSGWRETPRCSNVAGGISSHYPCTCGTTSQSGVKCQTGELCTATSDVDGVCQACGTDGANWRGFFGNEDLFGQPLTNIDSSCTCKTQCSESFDCEFWSYQKEARLCWLRKNFKSVQEDRSYMSGWRETPLCSNVAGGTSLIYPCTCGQTGRSGVKCQKGELCTATSDGGGVCQARLHWIVTDDFGTSCDRACEKKGLYCSETDWFGSDLNSAKVAFQAAGVPCSKGIRTAQDEQDLPISWKSDSRPCRIGKSSTCGATSAWQKWEDQVNTRRLCPCLQACKTASDCPSGYACFQREKGVRGECQAPGQNCRERGSKTECEDDQICHWCLPPKKMGTCMDKDKQCPVHISDNGSFTMPVISSPIEI